MSIKPLIPSLPFQLAALSFMFDKSPDPQLDQKAVTGFTMSATIAANYNLTTDFDALILTLCKFTGILNASKEMNEIQMAVALGMNQKAQLAAKTIFTLVQRFGDSMREGWKNIVEVLGQLFKLKLLPRNLVEIEDFCKPTGKYMLMPERVQVQRPEAAGLFSSLYSYLSSDNQRQPSYEEQEIIKVARKCVKECRIDQIVQESKFLHVDSLQEFLRALAGFLKPPTTPRQPNSNTMNNNNNNNNSNRYEEDMVLFMLEVYVRVLIQNKDRLLPIWDQSKDPLYRLLFNDGKQLLGYDHLLTRTTVEIFKLSALLMRSEELCPVVLQSLKSFLRFKPATVLKLSRPIAIGMYELLKTSAQHIHTEQDWAIVFTILECVGAGAVNREFERLLAAEEAAAVNNIVMAKSEGALSSEDDSGLVDRGYTSDSELIKSPTNTASPPSENWIMVTAGDVQNSPVRQMHQQQSGNFLAFPCKLTEHSPFALVKCWDSVAFIVRNVAHITPYNFEGCVRCIRTFVEASLSGPRAVVQVKKGGNGGKRKSATVRDGQGREGGGGGGSGMANNGEDISSDPDSDNEDLTERYPTIAMQFLDIMHTLHTRTANIFSWWAEEVGAMPQGSTLWSQAWCPLLQGMARLATDPRRDVRTDAISCLQKALLAHDLQTLSGSEWEGCFRQVLFPLLGNLLAEQVPAGDPMRMEESRMRTATIMSKVFLHHLTPLLGLQEFTQLWMEILEYLERFMRIGSDMLYEAMLEGLKNMLLVMHSLRVFHNADGLSHSQLWVVTWEKIGQFLPNLKGELFSGEEERVVGQRQGVVGEKVLVEQSQMPEVSFYPPQTEIEAQEKIVENLTVGESDFVSAVARIENVDTQLQQQGVEMDQPVNYPVSSAIDMGMSVGMEPNPIYNNDFTGQFSQSPVSGYQMAVETAQSQEAIYQQQQMIYQQQMQEYLLQQQQQQQMIPVISSATSSPQFAASPTHQPQVTMSTSPLHQQQQQQLTTNQYPTFTGIPPANIVQSFAPIYVQPTTTIQGGGEIFSDYVMDPYNRTLPSQLNNGGENNGGNVTIPQGTEPPIAPSNVFQSSNYFGSDTGIIPPGSEVLFGGIRP